MPGLKGMGFNKQVGGGDDIINEDDKKVEIDEGEVGEKQQKVIDKMNADNSSDDSDDDFEEEEEDSSEDDDSEDDESEEDSWLDDEEEDEEEEDEESEDSEEESEEEDEEETEEEESDEESDEEGSDSEDQEDSEDSAFEEEDVEVDKLSKSEREDKAVQSIFEKNKDILPDSFLENWQKYKDTGEKTFLSIDNHLHKLVKSVSRMNGDLPIEERLADGFELAFKTELREKISKTEKKKGTVEAEIKNQKINKAASGGSGGNSDSSKGAPKYSAEQKAMAVEMGVDLPGLKKKK